MKEIPRTQYLQELEEWKDNTDVVKVILGQRRVGKSVVMAQYVRKLLKSGISKSSILFIDFESQDYDNIADYKDLNKYIAEKLPRDKRTYIFLDEIQRVESWERTINSLMTDYDADVYITGSNAHMLSSELSTYISGRYVEIKVYPFSFKEFLIGHPISQEIDRNARFQQYLRTGGIPLTDPDKEDRYNRLILEGIYNTVLIKDVAWRMNVRDISGLNAIAKFLLDNIGNITNVDNIAKETKLTKITVKKYIQELTEAFLFFKVERYDIIGKKLLNSHEKYYSVDTGLARTVLDRGESNISRSLENIVFLELLRRGYRIRVGSFRDKEVDFTAEKDGKSEYFQVSLTMMEETTYQRELKSMKMIDDNYPKTVLSLDSIIRELPDGIIHRNVIEWILDDGLAEN